MKRICILVALAVSLMAGQDTPSKSKLMGLSDELQSAIDVGDWGKAAALSNSLRDAVRQERDRALSASSGALVDSILTWLPPDTETAVVAQQPFGVAERDQTRFPEALTMAQSYVLGLLAAAEKEQLWKRFVGRTIRLAAIGARRFRNQPADQRGATPLGMIVYQGCGAYFFAQPISESILARQPDESVMGHPVWVSKGSQNDRPDTDTYLIAIPQPDLIVACNDRGFLTETLSRMASPQQPRALPQDLPEWKQVDRTAPLWGLRHYHGGQASGDPTSVMNILGTKEDPQATGLTVGFGLESSTARAKMLAKSDPWKKLSEHPQFHGTAQSREVSRGVWEFSISGKAEAGALAVLALMSMLGFAVLV